VFIVVNESNFIESKFDYNVMVWRYEHSDYLSTIKFIVYYMSKSKRYLLSVHDDDTHFIVDYLNEDLNDLTKYQKK